MTQDGTLLPGRVLRRPGPAVPVAGFPGVQIDDPRLAAVLPADTALLTLYEGTLHAEGPVWVAAERRLYFSDVSNRRLLTWQEDGAVSVAVDATCFMNGNALGADGRLVHCEHGRRCISRSGADGAAVPIVTRYDGKRLNSPNDVTVAGDGGIWFTDPIFGLVVPSQGSLADPDLDHRSVYHYDPVSGNLHRRADFDQPNGLAFSPDGRILYVSDTAASLRDIPGDHPSGTTHEIQAFDVGLDGSLSGRRFFCHADHGVPDGLTVDRRGWVWFAAGDGIHIVAPDRTRLGYIPVETVCANCTFGDGRLFICAEQFLLAIDVKDS
jgi:gluconolactonase